MSPGGAEMRSGSAERTPAGGSAGDGGSASGGEALRLEGAQGEVVDLLLKGVAQVDQVDQVEPGQDGVVLRVAVVRAAGDDAELDLVAFFAVGVGTRRRLVHVDVVRVHLPPPPALPTDPAATA